MGGGARLASGPPQERGCHLVGAREGEERGGGASGGRLLCRSGQGFHEVP